MGFTLLLLLCPCVCPSVCYKSCPGCNFFVLWCRLYIFCMLVDYPKTLCHVPWMWAYNLEHWHHGQIPVFHWPTGVRAVFCVFVFLCRLLIFCMLVDNLKTMCHIPIDISLWPWTWPQNQISVFHWQTCVQAATFFVFQLGLLIFCMWVDHVKMMFHMSQIWANDVELWLQGQISVFLSDKLV